MFKKILLCVLGWYFLTGCAVLLPVHQVGSAQSLKKRTLRLSMIIGSAPEISSIDKEVTNVTEKTRNTNNGYNTLSGFQLAYGLTDSIDIEVARMSVGGLFFYGGDSLQILGIKYQYLGLPEYSIFKKNQRWSAAVRGRLFFDNNTQTLCKNKKPNIINSDFCDSEDKDNSREEFRFKYKNQGFSFAHIWGYRLNRFFSAYGGLQFLKANVKFKKDFILSKEESLKETRNVSLFGGFLGLTVNSYKQSGFNYFFSLESSRNLVTAVYEDKKIFIHTPSMAMGFSYQF